MFILEEIKTANDLYLKPDSRKHWEIQRDFYHEDASRHVRQHLRELGLGIARDQYPFESSLLRFIVNTLSNIYSSQTNRAVNDEPFNYPNTQTQAVLRKMDAERILYGQSIVRLYPDDEDKQVNFCLYNPINVYRIPNKQKPGDIRADKAFALQLDEDKYEIFTKTPDGWILTLQENDEITNPYGGLIPYDELPVIMVQDDPFSQNPWVLPRTTRTAYLLKLSALWNELLSAIRADANNEIFFEQKGKQTPPKASQNALAGWYVQFYRHKLRLNQSILIPS